MILYTYIVLFFIIFYFDIFIPPKKYHLTLIKKQKYGIKVLCIIHTFPLKKGLFL